MGVYFCYFSGRQPTARSSAAHSSWLGVAFAKRQPTARKSHPFSLDTSPKSYYTFYKYDFGLILLESENQFMTTPKKPPISPSLREFNRIYKEMTEFYHELARTLHLSDSIFDIFYSLSEMGDGCLQKDICQASCLPKQTVHSSIRKLEEDGYLTLQPGKGRNMHIYLTDTGKTLIEQKLYPVHRLESDAFSVMTEEECQKMLESYSKYINALRAGLPNLREDL